MRKSRIIVGICVFALFLILILPMSQAYAATGKSSITTIKANTTTKLQLDGKSAKEKVSFSVKTKKTEKDDEKIFTSTVKLSINGKQVLNKSFSDNSYKLKVQLVVTDVKKNDKYKDLFLAVYDLDWSGTYKYLIHITYKNGKLFTDNMLKTLKNVKSPKLNLYYMDMSRRGYELNPLESCKGLKKGDLVVSGNGSVKWHVCLYAGDGDYLHGYITLTLKSGKLKASNYPSGSIKETGLSGVLRKNLKLYKAANDSKKIATIAKGKKVKLTDFKYAGKKLYVRVKCGNKVGWASKSSLSSLRYDGTLHV